MIDRLEKNYVLLEVELTAQHGYAILVSRTYYFTTTAHARFTGSLSRGKRLSHDKSIISKHVRYWGKELTPAN